MKKNHLLLSLGLVSVITLSACGDGDDTEASAEQSSEPKTEENESEEASNEPEEDEEEAPAEEADNDWEMQVGDTNEDGVVRLLARNDTTETIETGSMSLDLPQVTVSEFVDWPEELNDFYDFEPTGLISIDMEVSNSSEDTINFYMDQATITTNTGEQLEPDFLGSDHIGGEFIGAVNKQGTIAYMLKDTDPNDVEWYVF
ncbi:hypothetical protein [Bacillus sp. JCM 19041]|uniref:hypothetical protein n=1 Tax=Bacillus sp. JCM 19041 TaxID=1460637 RepID=UPI0006CF2507